MKLERESYMQQASMITNIISVNTIGQSSAFHEQRSAQNSESIGYAT